MPFDIHIYGDQLASRFPQLNEWCPFSELVAGQPAFEVCRSMLASLQLVSGLAYKGMGQRLDSADALFPQANDYTDHSAARTGGSCGHNVSETAHTPASPHPLPDLCCTIHGPALSGQH